MAYKTISRWGMNKCIYLAVPKAANTSIKSQLLKIYFDYDLKKSDSYKFFDIREPKEIEKLKSDHLVFSFVRNPFDRALSLWKDKVACCNEAGEILKKHQSIIPGMGFPDFCRVLGTIPDEEADIHLQSQTKILTHGGALMPSFIGRVETIADDWIKLCKLMEFDPKFHKLPQERKSLKGAPETGAYYTPEAADIIRKRYAVDFETFSYKKELRC